MVLDMARKECGDIRLIAIFSLRYQGLSEFFKVLRNGILDEHINYVRTARGK